MNVTGNAKQKSAALNRQPIQNSVQPSSLATGKPMRSNTLPPPPVSAIAEALGQSRVEVSWLAGDGSDRCYYRIQCDDKSFVLMQLSGDDAVQLKNNGYEWVNIGRLLHEHGINAPQTVAQLPDFAALVIEDYGDLMMETQVLSSLAKGDRVTALKLYRQSFEILSRFLEIKDRGHSNWSDRSFDTHRLNWELHFFQEHFLKNILGWNFTLTEQQAFDAESLRISEFLASNSKYFVHRDFHSRNVMITHEKLAVIDFQDARLGPPTYDLVSICFDSYVPLSAAERRTILAEGLNHLVAKNSGLSHKAISEEWGPMLLQRQLKALGSFGYLTTQKNRDNYLKYVPAALETLAAANVGHSQWNFLSIEMIEGIRSRWSIA